MRRLTGTTIFSALITLAWLIAMGLLAERYYIARPAAVDVQEGAVPASLGEEQWMGVYLHGEKIGYSSSMLTRGEEGYVLEERMKMRLRVMGEIKEVETVMRAIADRAMRLVSFESDIISDFAMAIKGRVEGAKLLIDLTTGGKTTSQTIVFDREPSLEGLIVPSMLRKGLRAGEKVRIPVLDPSSMAIVDWDMEVAGKERVMSMNELRDAFQLKGNFKGMDFSLWITEEGEVLREESPLGFTLIREKKEEALQFGRPSLDLIAQASVAFNLPLPEQVQYLKLRISGIDLKGFDLDGGRQRLTGNVLEITRERGDELSAFSAAEGLDAYLRESAFVQSRDDAIVAMSSQIVAQAADIPEKARRIHEWVFTNIRKKPTVSIPSALEVLKAKQGDCNEHTTLYTALARAAGIPTRMAIGLSYQDGAFYYHAWPEVYLGKWVAIDPTLGQYPADAAHVRLIIGDLDEQIRLISAIGQIRLEGLEYQ